MDPVNFAVAQNIKRLREKQKLSMDELSRLSGVSKSMLAQIERGDGNPTLSSLWKIANGMRVPFDALTARPKPDLSDHPPARHPTHFRGRGPGEELFRLPR